MPKARKSQPMVRDRGSHILFAAYAMINPQKNSVLIGLEIIKKYWREYAGRAK